MIADEPHKPFKADDGERLFFSFDDKISMSIEYYDPDSSSVDQKAGSMALLSNGLKTGSNGLKNATENGGGSIATKMGNPNKRYLECPGSVKVQSLKKFISQKYGLSDEFVVDVIYKNDLIPEDYTLVDIAYAYNWRRDVPMQFFYRIFKKTKVLLKRRKRKIKSAESLLGNNNESSGMVNKVNNNHHQGNSNEKATNGNESSGGVSAPKKIKVISPPSVPLTAASTGGSSSKAKSDKVRKSPTSGKNSLTAVLAKTKTTSERFESLLTSSKPTSLSSPPKLNTSTSSIGASNRNMMKL